MEQDRLGRRIKAFRKLKGYTQIKFAQELGVPTAVLGSIERGEQRPNEDMLNHITHILDIQNKELLLEEREKEDHQCLK
ncbi:helix-turn-helix domain-containing protein [Lentibacillus saliphilus]|uniref:helix-turn-helix domain-containing protein n=1 Tax=Lentibacillus saliphilus TaxID=2737028 RepID=UPI001C2F522B|nr:helix-turn-helix transcriptional regulator [Lentibacillus saliphilus]